MGLGLVWGITPTTSKELRHSFMKWPYTLLIESKGAKGAHRSLHSTLEKANRAYDTAVKRKTTTKVTLFHNGKVIR